MERRAPSRRTVLRWGGLVGTGAVAGCGEVVPDDLGGGDGAGGDGTGTAGRDVEVSGELPVSLSVRTTQPLLAGDETGQFAGYVVVEATPDADIENPSFDVRLEGGRIERPLPGNFPAGVTSTARAAAGAGTDWGGPGTRTFGVAVEPDPDADSVAVTARVTGVTDDDYERTAEFTIPVTTPSTSVSRERLAEAADNRATVARNFARALDERGDDPYREELRDAMTAVCLGSAQLVGEAMLGSAVGAAGGAVGQVTGDVAGAVWDVVTFYKSPFEFLIEGRVPRDLTDVDRNEIAAERFTPPFYSTLLDQGTAVFETFEAQFATGSRPQRAGRLGALLLHAVADLAEREASGWRAGRDDEATALMRQQASLLGPTGRVPELDENELFGSHTEDGESLPSELAELDHDDNFANRVFPLSDSSGARRYYPRTAAVAHTMRQFMQGEKKRLERLREAVENGLFEAADDEPAATGYATEFTDGLDGWTVGLHPNADDRVTAGDANWSDRHGGSVALHVDGGPNHVGVYRAFDGLGEGDRIVATYESPNLDGEPGGPRILLHEGDGSTQLDRDNGGGDARESPPDGRLEGVVPRDMADGTDVEIRLGVWPGEIDCYVTRIGIDGDVTPSSETSEDEDTAVATRFRDEFEDGTYTDTWRPGEIDDDTITETDGHLLIASPKEYNDGPKPTTRKSFETTGRYRITVRMRTDITDYWGYGFALRFDDGWVLCKEHRWARNDRLFLGVRGRDVSSRTRKLARATRSTDWQRYSMTVDFDAQRVVEVTRDGETFDVDIPFDGLDDDSVSLTLGRGRGNRARYDSVSVERL
ncbi:hypothetical protein ACOZ4N_18210 [Halorientalis pallida]|uniref:hypothetical protein n=1 Tax=Halorientalis pallida TaxID=2479928 RepID=UPI003C6F7573